MVVDRLVATGRMAPELRAPLRAVLMARHVHLHQRQHGHATASAMLLPMIKSIAAAREAYRVRGTGTVHCVQCQSHSLVSTLQYTRLKLLAQYGTSFVGLVSIVQPELCGDISSLRTIIFKSLLCTAPNS